MRDGRSETPRFNAAVDVAHDQKPGAKLLGESAERKKDFSEISAYRKQYNMPWQPAPRRRAARDERAPLHSITSSARAMSAGGTVRPSILAVSWLMTISNFVDCTTGKSAGLAPLRIRPA